MKTKGTYLVVPLALMAAFVGYYLPTHARMEAALVAEREAAAMRAAAEDAARVERERIALAQQQQRVREHEEAEAKRIAQRNQEQENRDAELQASRIAAEAERERVRGEVTELNERRSELVTRREQSDAEIFAARRDLESARIVRRCLDLELQRSAEVIAESVVPGLITQAPLYPSSSPVLAKPTGT